MIAALYVRVSSEEQVDNFSISAQINMLTEYCKKNNIDIYHTYIDDGISAKYTDEKKRPMFNQMVRDAGRNLFDIILVHKYDRFARNVELSQRVKREIRQAGVNVISITEPVENSPIGFITEGLMELLAEYYIKNLSVEVKKGHLERARKGFHSGSVPYGYKVDHSHKAHMSINEEQAKIVKHIFDCYVLHGHGISKISKRLNESGIIGAVGGNWCPRGITNVLKNHKYVGLIRLGTNIFEGLHDPIIDMEIWERAQQLIKSRKETHTYVGNNHAKYYLIGLGKCGVCGRAVSIRTSNGRKYYACSGNRRNHEKVCDNKMTYNVDKLNNYVFDILDKEFKLLSKDFIVVKKDNAFALTEDRKKKLTEKLKRFQVLFTEQYITFEEFKTEKEKIDNELNEIAKMSHSEKKDDVITAYASVWEEAKSYFPHDPIRFRATIKKMLDCILISQDEIVPIFYSN